MRKLSYYTVVTVDRTAMPYQTRWQSPKAAVTFADRRYANRNVTAVAVFKGEPPDEMPDPRTSRIDVLHLRVKE